MPLIITREMVIQFVQSQQGSGQPVGKQLVNLQQFLANNRRIMTHGAKFYIRRKIKALTSYCPRKKTRHFTKN